MNTCCRACRSAYGTCLSNGYQCRCHRIAAREDNRPPDYGDPTGETAVNRVMRKQRRRNRRQK